MITLDFLFTTEVKFLYGAGGCVEVWAPSCNKAYGNSDRDHIFQEEISISKLTSEGFLLDFRFVLIY
jgi:hypothetical protein